MSGGAFDEEMGNAEPFVPPPSTEVVALCNAAAEIFLLTELIVTNAWIEPAADICRAADFSVAIHAKIFTRMVAEASAGRAVEAVTLEAVFRDDKEWVERRLLAELSAAEMNATRDRLRTRGYIEHIVMLSKRRRFVAGLQDAIRSARMLEVPLDEVARDADEALAAIAEDTAVMDQAAAVDFADRAILSFGKPILGVRSGLLAALDDITGTLEHGDQCILAGGTGMGKTATASSFSLGAAINGRGVLIVSQEMSGDQLARRLLADAAHYLNERVPHKAIRTGELTPEESRRTLRARNLIAELPIAIVDIGGMTVAKLKRRIRKQRRRFAATGQTLDMVVVDYLQLLQPSRNGMSTYEAVSEISRALKQLARDEAVVMLTLAQLSRAYEKRPTKRPEKSDLRDSGQIEQDADYIVLLHREEVFLLTEEPVGRFKDSLEYIDWRNKLDGVRGVIEFIVAKCRHGEPGKTIGQFYGANQAVRAPVMEGHQHG